MNERFNAIVGARISEFRRKMAEVKKTIRKVPNEVVVNVKVNYRKAQKRLDDIADTIRTLSTVGANMALGSLLAVSPSIVPILAATVGALAAIGPMMGVLAGSTFALATAFGAAGIAALAFGGAAIPTISKLFDENAKLNAQQKKAKKEFDNMKKTWSEITKELEKPVLEAFTKSMTIVNKMLEMSRPLFTAAAEAMNNLLTSLDKSLNSAPVKAFFEYLNKSAGPMLETMGKAMGNFTQGFFSMMVAFGPLAQDTAKGFLNMAQNFATWADGLKNSEKFQSFVSYIQENMPKLRAIFRDMTAGLIYMFAAFGPMSSDMMTGLQDMMARFKEWGKTLSQNVQFQKFIGYIQTNGPKVLTLIGNLVTFLINLGVALAPLGSKILDIINGFLSWLNNLMETNKAVGATIGFLIVMVGMFQALFPLIMVAWTMFAGFGALLLKLFPSLGLALNGLKLTFITGIKMMIQSMGRFILNVLKMAASFLLTLGKMIVQTVVMAAKMVVQIALMGAKWAWLGVKALLHAAKVAAAWFIALGPVGWVIAVIIALVALIIANWDKIKAWTKKAFTAVVSFIKDKLNSALTFVKGLGRSFYNAGKGLIQQITQGIVNAAHKVVNAVKNVVGKVRDFLPFSPAKDGPLKDINRLNFKGPIMDSIHKARRGVQQAMSQMLQAPRAQLAFDTGLNTGDFGRIKHDIGAEVSNFEVPEPVINVYNEWDGEKVVSYVEKGNATKSRITDGFYGK